MKRIVLGIIPVLVCLLFAGCKDDEFGERVKEGLPVSLTFRMSVPKATEVKTRASDEVETNVEKLGLIFYRYEGSKGQVIQIPADQIEKTGQSTSTHYYYTIKLSASDMAEAGITSGTYANLIALANWDKGFCTVTWNDLKDLTLDELKAYCVLKTNNQTDLTETALLLSGEYGSVTLKPSDEGGTTLENFQLKRLTAKITFNFNNGEGANFTPTEYEIYNYSRSSTLLERSGWTLNNGSADDTKGTNPGSLPYMGKDDEAAFASSTSPIQITGSSIMFYMLENVQTAKNSIPTTDSWAMREKRASETDRTFANAPDKGTYIVVRGTYSGVRSSTNSTQVTGNVTYTIHLGDFSSESGGLDNYTVRRNTKYTYDVTVTGVNSIIVEAESTTFNQETNPAVEGSIMASQANVFDLDAHFETVMLKIPANTDVDEYTLLVNTPYGMFTGQRDIKNNIDNKVADEHVAWVKFGKPASTSTFNAYPGDSKFKAGEDAFTDTGVELIDVNGFLALLKAENSGYRDRFFLTGSENGTQYYYVTAYVDEYYYDNETDYSKFINAANRRMALSSITNISPDRYSSYTESPVFSLTQRSIKSPFNLAEAATLEASNIFLFGVETVEETGPANLTAQDSEPSVDNDPRLNWGWRNLWEQLDGYDATEQNNEKFTWNTYVNVQKNGHFKNFDNSHEGENHTHEYLNAMQSTYVYGLYQCYSRNRDENGDGIINIHEMKWFLPAIQECTSIWGAAELLPEEARLHYEKYFSSTNGRYRVWWALEGTAFGNYKAGESSSNVRCIRMFGDWGKVNNEQTASISKYDATTRVISLQHLAGGTTRTAGSQVGEYTNHDLWGTQNKLPEAFQIAETDLTVGRQNSFTYSDIIDNNYCAEYYSEDANGSDQGQWRIPNQRELTLMFRHFKDGDATFESNSNLSNYTVARTTYQRTQGKALYYLQLDSGNKQFLSTSWSVSTANTAMTSFQNFKIRCVRDYVK